MAKRVAETSPGWRARRKLRFVCRGCGAEEVVEDAGIVEGSEEIARRGWRLAHFLDEKRGARSWGLACGACWPEVPPEAAAA